MLGAALNRKAVNQARGVPLHFDDGLTVGRGAGERRDGRIVVILQIARKNRGIKGWIALGAVGFIAGEAAVDLNFVDHEGISR